MYESSLGITFTWLERPKWAFRGNVFPTQLSQTHGLLIGFELLTLLGEQLIAILHTFTFGMSLDALSFTIMGYRLFFAVTLSA